MRWLASRLSRRFAIGTAAGLLASSLLFLMLFLAPYRAELASERASTAEQVNQLLKTSLENAMLKRDLEGLRLIVERLGQQPGIAAVFITNPRGEVRFASDPAMLGDFQPLAEGRLDAYTEFTEAEPEPDRLRSVNPVPNRPACKECHGPADHHPVNGILYVDYDAAQIRHKAQTTTLLLMGSGAIIVLLNLAGGWWFMRRYVLAPVGRLTGTSQGLAQGDLSRRTDIRGDDEPASEYLALQRKKFSGRRAEVASIMGISERSIYRMIKRLGLESASEEQPAGHSGAEGSARAPSPPARRPAGQAPGLFLVQPVRRLCTPPM